MVSRAGLAEPGAGDGDLGELLPAAGGDLADISEASDIAIWLDTVTNAEVANAYLSGVEGIPRRVETTRRAS